MNIIRMHYPLRQLEKFRSACLTHEYLPLRQNLGLVSLAALLFLVSFAIRSWDNLLNPGLYMEDAGHYFNAYYGGKRYLSFILQHPNGYYNILNNLIAWLASHLDVRLQALAYHLFSAFLGAVIAINLACTGLIKHRALLLVTPLALGLSGMNHIFYSVSLTFQMYNVVVLLLCLFFFPTPKTWLATACLALLATLLIWSGPYSVVAVPTAILALILSPLDKKTVLYGWIILCTLLYTLALEGGMIRFANILDPVIQEKIIDVLFGQIFLLDLLGEATPLGISLFSALLAAVFLLLRKRRFYLRISLLLFCIIILSLAPLFLSEKILIYQRVFPCHIYISQFFYVFFLLFTADTMLDAWTQPAARRGWLVALAIAAVVLVDNLRHPDKGRQPVMATVPAFLQAVHEAESLDLARHNQYLVLSTVNVVPNGPRPIARVGSRSLKAQRLTTRDVNLPSGNRFIAD